MKSATEKCKLGLSSVSADGDKSFNTSVMAFSSTETSIDKHAI